MISRHQEHTIVLHASRVVIPTQSICSLPCVTRFELVDSLVDSVAHGSFVPDQYRKPY
ncbi:hypothetical protein BS47DRAFT_1342324 [Hydnum rufescens UP504]|uniref:Uncharacterized protein n=1 Tax=Hydnum rufescens UP504 TaxID=1448309 RepID=A0A9P6B196_9AGAM|nr:hypothetical protein BS47DRAFT_1350354 [Hydnum rufescens UP504]KAF9515160.1 hypothetical protein BS47DRAFT_1342324 [Hydnum rufescens UP504]